MRRSSRWRTLGWWETCSRSCRRLPRRYWGRRARALAADQCGLAELGDVLFFCGDAIRWRCDAIRWGLPRGGGDHFCDAAFEQGRKDPSLEVKGAEDVS